MFNAPQGKELTSGETSSCRCCTDKAGRQSDGRDADSDARDVGMIGRNASSRRKRNLRPHDWPLVACSRYRAITREGEARKLCGGGGGKSIHDKQFRMALSHGTSEISFKLDISALC